MGYLSDLVTNPPQDRDACWLWSGYKRRSGHGGQITLPLDYAVRCGKLRAYPHQATYILLRGPIPEGLELDHLCFTPACVNPWHLEPVTHAENLRRRRNFREFGNVSRIRSGRWQVRYTGPDGIRRYAPQTFATEGEARAWLESARA